MRLLLPEQRQLDDLLDLYDTHRSACLRGGFVMSMDGAVAVDGGSRPLQGPADKVAFAALRAVCDAVVVGAGTARSEDYGPIRPGTSARAWRAAHGRRPAPLVLLSRSLQLDPRARAFTGEVRTIVLTCAAATVPDGLHEVADVVVVGDDAVDLPSAVAALHERGLTRLLCEGGPRLLTDLLHDGLLDELCLTLSPLLVGHAPTLITQALTAPVRLELLHLVDGGDGSLLVRYAVGRVT